MGYSLLRRVYFFLREIKKKLPLKKHGFRNEGNLFQNDQVSLNILVIRSKKLDSNPIFLKEMDPAIKRELRNFQISLYIWVIHS